MGVPVPHRRHCVGSREATFRLCCRAQVRVSLRVASPSAHVYLARLASWPRRARTACDARWCGTFPLLYSVRTPAAPSVLARGPTVHIVAIAIRAHALSLKVLVVAAQGPSGTPGPRLRRRLGSQSVAGPEQVSRGSSGGFRPQHQPRPRPCGHEPRVHSRLGRAGAARGRPGFRKVSSTTAVSSAMGP